MTSLYEIATEHRKIIDEIYSCDEMSLDQVDRLGNIEGDIAHKAISIASFIRNLEIESENITSAMKAMNERKGRLNRKIENISSYLKNSLLGCGISQITESPLFAIRIKHNPPSVIIDDEESIPEKFKLSKINISIDKNGIKESIKEGVLVPGARIEQLTRIEIK